MIPFRPTAQSQILRAARILGLRIEACEAGAFRAEPPFIERDVTLELELLTVYKGEVLEAPGDRITVHVTQTRNAGSRRTALPGVWSSVDLATGTELVAFSGPDGETATQALVDPVCFEVLPADRAVGDVVNAGMAHSPGSAELGVGPLIDLLERRGATYGPLFSGYLVDRAAEVFPDHVDDLAAVQRILEKPELGAPARFVLCSGLVARFILAGGGEIGLMRAFIASLCRLLAVPEATSLHEALATTWIPNLVGIEGGMPPIHRDDIFRGGPPPAQIAQALRQLANPDAGRPLLAWLTY